MTEDDPHTGVSFLEHGRLEHGRLDVPYTYEHVDNPPGFNESECSDTIYRIECFIRYTDIPVHKNVYYVRGDMLDFFFHEWGRSGEWVNDIRPISREDALEEIHEYDESVEELP